MAFTDNCDLFGAVNEDGINRVVQHLMRQRPSLFNHGTANVVSNPALLCVPANPTQDVIKRNNPIITEIGPLPVPGTNDRVALDFCFQLTQAELDFHPGDVIELPPQLNPPLEAQRFALRARVCGGLGCPEQDVLDELQRVLRDQPPPPSPADPIVPQVQQLTCFCLDLIAVGHFELEKIEPPIIEDGVEKTTRLLGKVDGLEIVDIGPEGLESGIECFLNVLIHLAVLPLLSEIAELPILLDLDPPLPDLRLTPSPAVLNNPAIEEDQLKVFLDIEEV